jgi:hypothetical protein
VGTRIDIIACLCAACAAAGLCLSGCTGAAAPALDDPPAAKVAERAVEPVGVSPPQPPRTADEVRSSEPNAAAPAAQQSSAPLPNLRVLFGDRYRRTASDWSNGLPPAVRKGLDRRVTYRLERRTTLAALSRWARREGRFDVGCAEGLDARRVRLTVEFPDVPLAWVLWWGARLSGTKLSLGAGRVTFAERVRPAALVDGRRLPPDDAWVRAVAHAMEQPVSCEFSDSPAADVAAYLSDISRVSFAVNPDLADMPFSGSFRREPLLRVLERFALIVGGDYEVAAGVIYVGPVGSR